MSLIDTQQEILTRLKLIPNIGIHDDELPDEVEVTMIPGSDQIRPFATISFGGMVEVPSRLNGIAGAARDTGESTIVVQGVGSTAMAARRVVEQIRKSLVGYTPTNCGEIRNALFGGTGKLSHLGNPTRYGANQSFRFYQNADV